MSILVKVYYSLLADTRLLTGVHLDFPDDLTVSWVLIEGPALDKQLLQFLEGNRDRIPTFPEWLKPLWDAFVINNNDSCILKALRTLLVFGYKAEFEPNEKQLQDAQKAFEEANEGCRIWSDAFKASDPSVSIREACRLVRHVINRANWSDVVPNHGPGAVFPRHSPSSKSNFNVCTQIAECYPYDTHFNCLDNLGSIDRVWRQYVEYDSILCNMVAVPKDSRGPRLICVHPKEAVWIQQGQRHVLERVINHHHLTSRRINFDDQKVNGQLALEASSSRRFVTIDMKEASDRISRTLVDYLFGFSSKFLNCSRARHVKLLDGTVVELQMFAPMGNALTFPVESLVFWALVRAGILSRHGHNCDEVYVFGDDIIVPTEYYDGAILGLIRAGLIPNASKTFVKGLFRESCGVDAYNGKDVTPYRMKVRGVNSFSDGESLCDLAKRLRLGGYIDTSAYLYSCVSRALGRLSMTNDPDCQGLQEYVNCSLDDILRYEPRVTWCYEWHAWMVDYRKLVRPIEALHEHAWWHVQDSLLALERKSRGQVINLRWSREAPLESEYWYGERGLSYPSPRGERLSRGLGRLIPKN